MAGDGMAGDQMARHRTAGASPPGRVHTGASDVHTGASAVHTGASAVHTGVSAVPGRVNPGPNGASGVQAGGSGVNVARDAFGDASSSTGVSGVNGGSSGMNVARDASGDASSSTGGSGVNGGISSVNVARDAFGDVPGRFLMYEVGSGETALSAGGQLRALRVALALATLSNRTLVLPSFYCCLRRSALGQTYAAKVI